MGKTKSKSPGYAHEGVGQSDTDGKLLWRKAKQYKGMWLMKVWRKKSDTNNDHACFDNLDHSTFGNLIIISEWL